MLKERPHFPQIRYVKRPALAHSLEKVVNITAQKEAGLGYHFSLGLQVVLLSKEQLLHLPQWQPPLTFAS